MTVLSLFIVIDVYSLDQAWLSSAVLKLECMSGTTSGLSSSVTLHSHRIRIYSFHSNLV